MATRSSFEEDLSCPVCCDIFKDPVMMLCGHSFCKICLQKSWKEKKYRECPMCRSKSSKTEPCPNLNLRSLCETFLKPPLDGQTPSKKCKTSAETLCHLHCETFKLFCLDDDQPICVVCRDSRNHKAHNCKPVDELAEDLKNQVQSTERQINKEFKKLRLFLHEEEGARIAALREEEQNKCLGMRTKITEINGKISSLSETIRAIEEEMRTEDVAFVKNYKATMVRAQIPLTNPPLVSGPVIDVDKHLDNVPFRVWEKMRGVVKDVPVSLDLNPASPCLPLSDDLTSAMLSVETQQPSDNPEVFELLEWFLGSERETSGTI
ncbi:tripartite motif-containing protein 35 isoform X2 [Esox lucius]|uniref:tripartite motif-containing protein 35 isoform X2 n=1 Tax=Esox lucius TaxID=8010 RepID=UPI001476EA07|nr:tripartite motif-containing protein 35 isoform X2 [Esox lucius]